MAIKGDFTGFSFGSWNSMDEETGIVKVLRVSSGDRYNETLHPEIKDKVVEVPGVNGSYYFGSDYGPMQFDIDIAFDHLTESQFREMRKAFATKQPQKLIFAERPYKYYMAKLASPIELSYVCFEEQKRNIASETQNGVRRDRARDDSHNESVIFTKEIEIPAGEVVVYDYTSEHTPDPDNPSVNVVTQLENQNWGFVENTTYIRFDNIEGIKTETAVISFFYLIEVFDVGWEQVTPYVYLNEKERIYKGEGKISLICYFPFAKSNFKALPEEGQDYYDGRDIWAESSGLLTAGELQSINTFDDVMDGRGFEVYNAGDLPMGFRLYCPFESANSLSIKYYKDVNQPIEEYDAILNIAAMEVQGEGQDQDIGVLIDTNIGLIYGMTSTPTENSDINNNTSNHIYNQYIASGSFFKIEPHEFNTDRSKLLISKMGNNNTTIALDSGLRIFYDYLYF